jgi:hypothetical protein
MRKFLIVEAPYGILVSRPHFFDVMRLIELALKG